MAKVTKQRSIPDAEYRSPKGLKKKTIIPKSDPLPQRLQNNASKSAILRFYRNRKQPVPKWFFD